MPEVEISGTVFAQGTASAVLSGQFALIGTVSGKGRLGAQPPIRVFEDAGGILGEVFFVDETGVEVPTDVSTLTDGRIPVWREADKKVVWESPATAVPGGGGGGSGPSGTPPVTADFTWQNQLTATITDDGDNGDYLEMVSGTGAFNWHIRKKAAPATPYVVTAKIQPVITTTNAAGLIFRKSATGELAVISIGHSGNLNSSKWSSPTAFNAHYIQKAVASYQTPFGPYLWFQIEDDGTNRKVHYSFDGMKFFQLHSVGRTDFLTADEIGFGILSAGGADYAAMRLWTWDET